MTAGLGIGTGTPEAVRLTERVRGLVPAGVYVSGLTAMTDDLTRQLADTLPVFVAATLVASFLFADSPLAVEEWMRDASNPSE